MRVLVTLAAFAALVAANPVVTAQCVPVGSGCPASGMDLTCSAPPTIGTTWNIGERNASICGGTVANPAPMFTMFGGCFPTGIPLPPPLACPSCVGCFVHAFPEYFTLQWSWPPRTLSLPIPNDPGLIGATMCMQSYCGDMAAGCVCTGNAWQITIQ